jgi:hypothetical protein
MTMVLDFFGLYYDDAEPAFLSLDYSPHPLNEDGTAKFCYHRRTRRIIDLEELTLRMAAAGYTPPASEFGEDKAWLREYTEFGPPFDFTMTLDPAQSRSDYLVFTFSGGPATERVWVNLPGLVIDGSPMRGVAYNSRYEGFWAEVGMTLDTFVGKFTAIDLCDNGNIAGLPIPIDQAWRIMDSQRTAGKPEVIFRSRAVGAWATGADIEYRFSTFEVSGVNMVWDGIPVAPHPRILTALSKDRKTAILTPTGPTVPRLYPTTHVDMYSIWANGQACVESTTAKPHSLELAPNLSTGEVAAVLAAWLNNMVGQVQGTPGPFTLHAVAEAGSPFYVSLTATVTATGAAATFDNPPVINTY